VTRSFDEWQTVEFNADQVSRELEAEERFRQTTEINPLVRGFYDRVLEPVGFGQVAKRGYDILTR